MPTEADAEAASRARCDALIKRIRTRAKAGEAIGVTADDWTALAAVDRARLLSCIESQKHVLARHAGRQRVDVPGPGFYTDGLRQGSAAARERRGRCVKYVPALIDGNAQQPQPPSPRSARSTAPLPPLPLRPAPGPTLSGRHASPEERQRMRDAARGPGMYDVPPPGPSGPPIAFKFRQQAADLNGKREVFVPGPGMYDTGRDAFPYQRPSQLMNPQSRVKVASSRVPGPGTYGGS